MVRRRTLLTLWLLMIVGCSRHQAGPTVQIPVAQIGRSPDAPIRFPGFRVAVSLSGKAKETLVKKKETVVVFAMYTGALTPEARRTHDYEMGEVGLGSAEVEITPGQTAQFGKAVLDQNTLEQTDKKDPLLLINVSSGRKSSGNNLLECDLYEGSLAAVQHKSIPISCSLIDENAPSSYIKQNQLKP